MGLQNIGYTPIFFGSIFRKRKKETAQEAKEEEIISENVKRYKAIRTLTLTEEERFLN